MSAMKEDSLKYMCYRLIVKKYSVQLNVIYMYFRYVKIGQIN